MLEKLDLLNPRACQSIINKYTPGLVFYLAGQSSVAISLRDSEGTFSSIVNTTHHLLHRLFVKSPLIHGFLFPVVVKSLDSIKVSL